MAPPPPPLPAMAPPMPWKTRIMLKVASAVTDMCRRDDGTMNRRLVTILDPRMPADAKGRRGVASVDVTLDAALPLSARVFFPVAGVAGAEVLPVVVFFHGGGFAALSAASFSYDAVCKRFARKLPAVVVSVEYRRSPEHKFPAPYDDGFQVLKAIDGGTFFDTLPLPAKPDVASIILAGDSAGANIAHHVARRHAASASTFTRVRLAGIVSIQPFFGGEERTPSELRLVGAPIVNLSRTDWMWKAFLPEGASRDHEAANVFDVTRVSGLPAVLLVVGGFDPLQDWQRKYGEVVKAAGVEIRVLEYPTACHAFYLFPELPESGLLIAEMKDFITGCRSKKS